MTDLDISLTDLATTLESAGASTWDRAEELFEQYLSDTIDSALIYTADIFAVVEEYGQHEEVEVTGDLNTVLRGTAYMHLWDQGMGDAELYIYGALEVQAEQYYGDLDIAHLDDSLILDRDELVYLLCNPTTEVEFIEEIDSLTDTELVFSGDYSGVLPGRYTVHAMSMTNAGAFGTTYLVDVDDNGEAVECTA